MKQSEDINDNEIRLIGGKSPGPNNKRKWVILLIFIAFVMAVIALATAFWPNSSEEITDVPTLFEPTESQPTPHPLRSWLYDCDTITQSGCVIKDTIVNDITIRIYLPCNAVAALKVGTEPLKDSKVIFATQAADIRADNKRIVGAFVEKGKPIAWGLSKKGYCAILHDSIIIGMADNSPLFEEATDCGGFFFRQYPLVSNGQPQESELRSQFARRALCDVEQHIVVIESIDRASIHDFSVLLADLGVSNAIYLVGGDAMGIYTTIDGNQGLLGPEVEKPYKYTNFIYWSKR